MNTRLIEAPAAAPITGTICAATFCVTGMLKRAATETGDKARDLRSQVETKLLRAKLSLQELEGHAVDKAKAAARATDDYVHDNPWQAIGVAAAVGIVVGLLMNRR